MTTPAVSLGYAILYVPDVAASLAFYEKAFGLTRRFFNDDNGVAYGELQTGAACLAFASLELAKGHLQQPFVAANPGQPPLGVEIALVSSDVDGLYRRAVDAGAVSLQAPEKKPWGQTVALLRDNAGHLVEICTPMS